VKYYALVDEPEFPLSRPLSLLRRPGGEGPLEHLGTDGGWWPDRRPELLSGETFHELVELTADEAAALEPLWTGR